MSYCSLFLKIMGLIIDKFTYIMIIWSDIASRNTFNEHLECEDC